MGKIVLEDFNEGNGYYKINLAYLNKEQVEEIEAIVSKWKPTDEDIKSCIATCLTDANEQRFKDYGTNLKDCLAWLEKQGEQKVSIVDFKAEDWYVSKVDGKIHYMKYNPNKGLVWSEDDERMHNASIRACQYMVENFENSTRDYEDAIDWLKSLKNKVQPKQEWSEKDETALCDVLWCCKQAASIAKDENDMGNIWYAEKWLKSLKDRVQPQPKYEWKQENTDALTDFENVMMHIGISFFGQHAGLDPNDTSAIKEQANILLGLVPKQEWSEKDEEMFDAIIADIQFTQKTHNHEVNQVVYEREIDWLKSLKDRYSWKPSKEQMKGIDCAIKTLRHQLNVEDKRLNSLYEQLKKL